MTSTLVTAAEIVSGLRALGTEPGGILFVHSSLSSFGRVEGGPDAVIDALLHSVRPRGTVVVPTFTGTAADGPSQPPRFDVRSTPCWTGAIPETLRRRTGARRSLHPTHSVAAIGDLAEELLAGHERCETPCGTGSPFVKLADRGASVVLIGVGFAVVTLLHTAEELAKVDYHLQAQQTRVTMTDSNGNAVAAGMFLHQWGTERAFGRMEALLAERKLLRVGTIGNAEVRIFPARALVDIACAQLERDARFLVKGNG